MKKRIIYCLLIINILIESCMTSPDPTSIKVHYKSFLTEEKFRNPGNVDSLIVFNPAWLVFPPIGEDLPIGGVEFEIPSWISAYSSVRVLAFSHLYVSNFSQLSNLDRLEELTVCLKADTKSQEVVSTLANFKNLRILNLSGSLISDNDFLYIQTAVPSVKVIEHSKLFR